MKNYSRKAAGTGKTAYRTPSSFRGRFVRDKKFNISRTRYESGVVFSGNNKKDARQ